MRIHGWLEYEDGKVSEFFIAADGDYEVRSAEVVTLEESREVVKALAEAAKPLLTASKPRISWD